ncbi:hypothetical protein F5B22DRAFT_281932 [Xylaria bambusicola]|uniref:uncharacterized protein n=1 Tax=Xylaria bambusicola TaxID=326684 RepID=UPI002007E7C4|nr:uncharacterized protein F5B22DRAFT_281932 [Xylaria bambusicola]KAI0512968.1 hypothetical protein F5B22DRAFT_281932 [Xylaria bambusicola]
MMRLNTLTCSTFFLPCVIGSVLSTRDNNTSSETVEVKWLEGTPALALGTTFGLPWPKGKHLGNQTTFLASTTSGEDVSFESWATSYWADGSVKWTGHAVEGSKSVPSGYKIRAVKGVPHRLKRQSINVVRADDEIFVDTGKLKASFPTSGNVLVSSLSTSSGKIVGQNGKLIIQSQSGAPDTSDNSAKAGIDYYRLESHINTTTIDGNGSVRTLITIRGDHRIVSGDSTATHDPWVPFTVRFYLYANSDTIRIVHTLIFDGEADKDFITGIGLRFDVPLEGDELYDRHVRIAGVDGGFLSEAVQGITGLRRDPGRAVRAAQFEGKKTPDIAAWDTRVRERLQWIPTWNDYTLTQLSPDGFTLKKRTKAGQSWVKIPGGTRAGGLAYLGGATTGGLAIGHRDFWKQYPTGIDISNAATDLGQITLWLYSPAGEPMDLRPFHDGLGQDTYAKQLDALEITYEDYEGGYNTPHGIGKTSEIFIRPFDSTPSSDELATLTGLVNEPPVLVPDPAYVKQTEAMGTYWDIPNNTTRTQAAQTIEKHLEFLNKFYQGQVEQRRWYGFWDYGDFMHTYDTDRHVWRYDVGGYAWDNSELSPNLFFWNYFLRTGRADVYRFAEAHARHTSEVDVYHLGPYNGFGTRHGVQHWADSAKQIRVSTPLYRQVFYYVTGGDERIGELLHDLMDADKTFLTVDPRRKVRQDNGTYVPDPTAIDLDLGIDFSGLAAIWLIEWERRGPRWEEARLKLNATMQGIASLKNGFVTGVGLYNIYTGEVKPPATDPENRGHVEVSHLFASFGLPEIMAQITQYMGDDLPAAFDQAWLDYCYYYGAGAAEQRARYGSSFGSLSLKQGHSRLTAYAAKRSGKATLAARAWNEFLNTDGFAPTAAWNSVSLNGSQVLAPVDEAAWISTNDVALYGLAAIENLAQVGSAL